MAKNTKVTLPSVAEMAKAKNITLITDAAALDKMGRDLANTIRQTDNDIRTFLLSEMAHIEEHRNPTRLNKFLSALRGSGARVNAMHNFIQLFFNVRLNEKAETKKDQNGNLSFKREEKVGDTTISYVWYYDVKKVRKADDFKMAFAKALEKNWWEYRPEPAPRDFIFDADRIAGTIRNAFNVLLDAEKQKDFKSVEVDKSLLHDLAAVLLQHGYEYAKLMPNEDKNVQPLQNDELFKDLLEYKPTAANDQPADTGNQGQETTGEQQPDTGAGVEPDADNEKPARKAGRPRKVANA